MWTHKKVFVPVNKKATTGIDLYVIVHLVPNKMTRFSSSIDE